MDILILAQTVFYLVISTAIVAFGVLFAISAYHLIYITKNLHSISNDLSEASHDTKEEIKEIIDRLSRVPILSFFLKKSKRQKVSAK